MQVGLSAHETCMSGLCAHGVCQCLYLGGCIVYLCVCMPAGYGSAQRDQQELVS